MNVFLFLNHSTQAFFDDHCHLVGVGGVVGEAGREGRRHQGAVAILVLQTFSIERRAASGGSQKESAATGVSHGPDLVSDTLEAEHGVEDVEGDGHLTQC